MTTEERLEKLERRNRLLLIGLVLAVAAFALGALADEKTFNVIRAKRFILEGKNGKIRAMLNVDESGRPGLGLFDENGVPIVVLYEHKGEAGLGLGSENGKPIVSLKVTESGPILSLNGKNGKACAMLCVSKGEPILSLDGTDGKTCAILGVTKDGASMNLLDENGKPLWKAP